MTDTTITWQSIISVLLLPLAGLLAGMMWRVLNKIDSLGTELRRELADRHATTDQRLAALESFRATAANDFTDREDFVRESLLTRKEMQDMNRNLAELRGESSAAIRVAERIAASIESVAHELVSATKPKDDHATH